MGNRRILATNNTSGFKGVTWNKRASKWQSSIEKNEKYIYLGLYVSLEDAAKAYDKAAKELFGDFAQLNFIIKKEFS